MWIVELKLMLLMLLMIMDIYEISINYWTEIFVVDVVSDYGYVGYL